MHAALLCPPLTVHCVSIIQRGAIVLSDDDSRLLECGVSMGVLLQAIARQYGQAKPRIDIQKVQASSVPLGLFKSES